MEWADILTKIGVGACLGFGIIALAKLTRKKNVQDSKTLNSGSQANSTDKKNNEQ